MGLFFLRGFTDDWETRVLLLGQLVGQLVSGVGIPIYCIFIDLSLCLHSCLLVLAWARHGGGVLFRLLLFSVKG